MRAVLTAAIGLALSGPVFPAFAQQTAPLPPAVERGAVISPILTIDSERLFRESAFGMRVAAEIEAQSTVLATENRQIEADLEAEERALTDTRSTTEPEAFRVLADAFDQKVQETRQAREAKGRALNERLDQERNTFLAATDPVLQQLMRAANAAVILELRSVRLSVSAVEITDEAIALLDETLGNGTK